MMLSSFGMGISRCRMAYQNDDGVHSVEVTAETLYEAVAAAVAAFHDDTSISEQPGPSTAFAVTEHRPPIQHMITLQRVTDWAKPSTRGGPGGITRREKVRALLNQSHRT